MGNIERTNKRARINATLSTSVDLGCPSVHAPSIDDAENDAAPCPENIFGNGSETHKLDCRRLCDAYRLRLGHSGMQRYSGRTL